MAQFYPDVVSPLADPVISAIFANVEVAGKAADSLIRRILATDGETIGKILNVTPQYTHEDPFARGCRVDIDVEYTKQTEAIVEVQVYPDSAILQRNLLSFSHKVINKSRKGDSHQQMAARMPKIISINLLAYPARKDNSELVQPFKILYTKSPQVVAIPNFSGYNIQLPAVLDMPPDFEDGLYCWCYTLYAAHIQGKTIEEVLQMQPQLKAFLDEDEGYKQFCDRFDYFSATPEERDRFISWQLGAMRQEGMFMAAEERGIEIGLARGLEQGLERGLERGLEQGAIATATRMLSRGYSIEDIIFATELPAEIILSLKITP
ncbi:MAG: PD-(D/E)XK nuclease family transposase [Turicibacter sp.]|nr:PD-(D/E)XK nuclease family transposase [Turicibacter sp.]